MCGGEPSCGSVEQQQQQKKSDGQFVNKRKQDRATTGGHRITQTDEDILMALLHFLVRTTFFLSSVRFATNRE